MLVKIPSLARATNSTVTAVFPGMKAQWQPNSLDTLIVTISSCFMTWIWIAIFKPCVTQRLLSLIVLQLRPMPLQTFMLR